MMIQAFYTGISGLQTNQSAIDTVSDNLANTATVGFRGYNTEFASLFEKAVNTGSDLSSSIGVGVKVQANSMNQDIGSVLLSDRSTDLALMDEGWFAVTGDDKTLYTRAGDFGFDKDSDIVTTDGFYLLGTMGGNISNGVLTSVLDEIPLGNISAQEKLNFPNALTYPAEASSIASFYGNIGLDETTVPMSAGVVDPQDNRNDLGLVFTQVSPQVSPGSQWDVTATTKNLDGSITYDTQTGMVNFNAQGALISNTLGSINNNGAQVAIDLGTGFDGIVAQSGMPAGISSSSNGIKAGDLQGYEINQNAEIIATFTNGIQSSVGKVAVYHFINDQGLDRVTGTRFSESSNSGEPVFYKDENGQNINGTTVSNYHLESSNVKMEVGLTDLIIFQRSYDASSKCITTADEMMQKALSMDA